MANYDFSGSPSYPQVSAPSASASSDPPTPLPAPFITIPNIYNFRHLGSHRLPNGRRTRTDLIYRSAEPSRINSSGISALQNLKVSSIYDLRSESEILRNTAHTPVTDIPGTSRIAIPVFGPASRSDHARRMGYYGEDGSQGFVKAYLDILDAGRDAYRAVFTHVRDRPDEPLLVHCTAGKDRTGVLVALALGVVGVRDSEIAEEYALTELGLKEWKDTMISHILMDPSMESDRGRVERMVGAKEENMSAFLPELRNVWGGPEGYLRQGLGFGDEDIEAIKRNLTVADDAVDG